ncbi:hypothetical protein M758_6G023200 [Ceratodon purpureus]|nr:hypothetical protein M758_6G023200 [Ceratodon purpureus]
MSRFEPFANRSRQAFPYEDPLSGSLNSGVSSLPDSGQSSAANTVAVLESIFLYGEQDGGLLRGRGVAELVDSQYFQSADEYNYASQIMETEQLYHRPSMPVSSFDSGVTGVSDSTFASGHTLNSMAELGEVSTEDFPNNFFEGLPLWLPGLLSAHGVHSSMNVASHSQTRNSACVPIENDGSFHAEASVIDPGVEALLPPVTRSARMWPGYVRVVCACNRFKSKIDMLKGLSKRGTHGKRKRSAETAKYSCEIRISKKIPRDDKYLKEKLWIGTFATPAQKGRALDVGKYFLCTKKKKTFFDPKSEAALSAFKDLQALPLTELVETVIKLAKHYGENGSLPRSLDDL